MLNLKHLIKREEGYAVIEATFVFPIMIMFIVAVTLMSMYLPTRAVLQRATQYAATVLATEKSDTWYSFHEASMEPVWQTKEQLPNVYSAFFRSFGSSEAGDAARAKAIIEAYERKSLSMKSGVLQVSCQEKNYLVYKDLTVTARRTFKTGMRKNNLVGFPEEISITVSSTAAVQNGDEFVRNMDIAVDFTKYLAGRWGLDEVFQKVSEAKDKIKGFMGWT